MPLDPFFQQGMNAWGDRIKAQEGRAATLNAATRSNEIKNILAQKKAAVDIAAAKQGNLNKLAQIGLQYNQQMPEYAKHMYGDQENQGLRALQQSKVWENLGKGIGPIAAKTGIQPHQAGLAQILRGLQPHLGQLITKPPTDVLSSAAGAGTNVDTIKNVQNVLGKSPQGHAIIKQQTATSKKKRPAPSGKPTVSKQQTAVNQLITANPGAQPMLGKNKQQGVFKFPHLPVAVPVVKLPNGALQAVMPNGTYVDVTSYIGTKP